MICVNLTGLVLPSENTYAAAVFVARCENIVSIPLVCLSIGCPLGCPAGVGSMVSISKQTPFGLANQGTS
jgi:hypothetical protein